MTDLRIYLRKASLPSVLALCFAPGALRAQAAPQTAETQALPAAPAPTAAAIAAYEQTLPGKVTVLRASSGPTPLSLEDAIALGLRQNVQIAVGQQNERRVQGLTSTAVNALLPTLEFQGYTNAQEINLAALGFKPQSLGPLLTQFGLSADSFSSIVKVDVTNAQINLSQQLFNVPAFYLYRAAQRAQRVAQLETLNTRGGVALMVGRQYLAILADAAQVQNARGQVRSDQASFEQARDRQQAGVGVHLDTLRAQVQLQAEQQSLVNAENNYAKDRIQLNRLMGVAADQEYTLTDTTPFADLAMLPKDVTLEYAFTKRKDLLSLQQQMEVAQQTARAVRFERLPTLAASGFYGVIGETHGLYHGVFNAQEAFGFRSSGRQSSGARARSPRRS